LDRNWEEGSGDEGDETLTLGDPGAEGAGTSQELVSVILPTHFRPERLGRAIRSALDQTHKDLEIVVVDDESTPENPLIVEGFKDPRLRFIRLEGSRGVPGARNAGIQVARGSYIAFLDDDDEWMPSKIEKQLSDLRAKGPAFKISYCIREFYNDEKGETTGHSKKGWDGNHTEALITGQIVPSPSCVLLEATCLKRVGGFQKDLTSLEDRELWLRLSEFYDFAFLNEVLVRMHVHREGRISDNIHAMVESLEIIYQAHKRLLWRHRRALSEYFLIYGYWSEKIGNSKGAIYCYARSISAYPFFRGAYISLASLVLKKSRRKQDGQKIIPG
jgi:glycosyltransferase involved in cell wall biosynthesis